MIAGETISQPVNPVAIAIVNLFKGFGIALIGFLDQFLVDGIDRHQAPPRRGQNFILYSALLEGVHAQAVRLK